MIVLLNELQLRHEAVSRALFLLSHPHYSPDFGLLRLEPGVGFLIVVGDLQVVVLRAELATIVVEASPLVAHLQLVSEHLPHIFGPGLFHYYNKYDPSL